MNTRDRGYSPHTSNGTSSNSASTSQQMAASSPATAGNLKTASLNEIWQDLKLGIESVYSQQTMSKPRYMTLYSFVYFSF
jgi:hypothetical protein